MARENNTLHELVEQLRAQEKQTLAMVEAIADQQATAAVLSEIEEIRSRVLDGLSRLDDLQAKIGGQQ